MPTARSLFLRIRRDGYEPSSAAHFLDSFSVGSPNVGPLIRTLTVRRTDPREIARSLSTIRGADTANHGVAEPWGRDVPTRPARIPDGSRAYCAPIPAPDCTCLAETNRLARIGAALEGLPPPPDAAFRARYS